MEDDVIELGRCGTKVAAEWWFLTSQLAWIPYQYGAVLFELSLFRKVCTLSRWVEERGGSNTSTTLD